MAETGQEALVSATTDPPSLILLDLMLPDVNGVEVCRLLKSNETTSRVPVVILTGAGTSENRILCLEIGAEDFLTKPVIHEELIARVRSLLRAKHLSDRLLISFLELDKLGTFAETFSSQSVTDWSAMEVATSLAEHLLASGPGEADHPTLLWAAHQIRHQVLGVTWSGSTGMWSQQTTSFEAAELRRLIEPFNRGSGQYVSKQPPPDDLCQLLHFPTDPRPRNLAGLWVDDNIIMAAGYPWEVGAYELPLLRAVLRHWKVFERIRHEARQAEQAFFCTMETLALAAEFYDSETATHIRRVSTYSRMLARTMGCQESFIKWIAKSAPMHDVGKITIPIDLVRKPELLSPVERSLMARHTCNGARLLGCMPPLAVARNIAAFHHENFDGSGYPDGRAGEDIPIEARIVKVADVYDALRSARPYKQAIGHDQAIRIMRLGDGRTLPGHFDGGVLEAFLEIQRDIAKVYASMSGPEQDTEGVGDG